MTNRYLQGAAQAQDGADIKAGPDVGASENPFLRIWSELCESSSAVIGLVVFAALVLMAVFASYITPQNPYDLTQVDVMNSMLPPMTRENGVLYVMGTDEQGRDVLSAILYGLRTSLVVGFTSTAFSLAIGLCVGLCAAYAGGWIDALLMRLVDLQLGIPTILIALILLALFGRGVDKVILALVVVQWAYYARTVRAAAIVERNKEYIDAAVCQGLSGLQIGYIHLLRNCLPPVIVVATMQIAHSIALEATLSFLGVGVPITEPSLGLLISNGFNFMLSGDYWISFFPGLVLFITVLSVNFVGDRLRDILNPRLKK